MGQSNVGGSITVRLIISFSRWKSTASLNTKINIFYFLVKSSLVKLTTSCMVILPSTVSVLWTKGMTDKVSKNCDVVLYNFSNNLYVLNIKLLLRIPCSQGRSGCTEAGYKKCFQFWSCYQNSTKMVSDCK